MTMQKKKTTVRDVIVIGFALFSMFFGAGNVVFPPYLGLEAGPEWLTGFTTYFIADIGLALVGLFALLRVGSSEAVLNRVGRVPAEILMCAIILCIGPMVAIPRTSASTYEMAIAPNISGVSPILFSAIFFALILALCIKESAVVDIVGKILTPLLLLGLFAIIIKGVITPLGEPSALPQIANVAVTGIKAGYQTMDALAALPFGIIVLQSVTDKAQEMGQTLLNAVVSTVLHSVAYAVVYLLSFLLLLLVLRLLLAPLHLFTKLPEEYPLPPQETELVGLTLQGLTEAFLRIWARKPVSDESPETNHYAPRDIHRDEHNVQECMLTLLKGVSSRGCLRFEETFSAAPSKEEVVTLFLALLELLKLGEIHVEQEGTWSEIVLYPGRGKDVDEYGESATEETE